MKAKQKDWIIAELTASGYITRNYCLRNYISRLASHINVLEKEGWEFATEKIETQTQWGKGYDYKYNVVVNPLV